MSARLSLHSSNLVVLDSSSSYIRALERERVYRLPRRFKLVNKKVELFSEVTFRLEPVGVGGFFFPPVRSAVVHSQEGLIIAVLDESPGVEAQVSAHNFLAVVVFPAILIPSTDGRVKSHSVFPIGFVNLKRTDGFSAISSFRIQLTAGLHLVDGGQNLTHVCFSCNNRCCEQTQQNQMFNHAGEYTASSRACKQKLAYEQALLVKHQDTPTLGNHVGLSQTRLAAVVKVVVDQDH